MRKGKRKQLTSTSISEEPEPFNDGRNDSYVKLVILYSADF